MVALFKNSVVRAFGGLLIVIIAVSVAISDDDTSSIHATNAEQNHVLTVGHSKAFFHYTPHEDRLTVHVMLISTETDEVLQTSVAMRDGQSYRVVVRSEEMSEDHPGHELVFVRDNDRIEATAITAKPEARIAGIFWPFR